MVRLEVQARDWSGAQCLSLVSRFETLCCHQVYHIFFSRELEEAAWTWSEEGWKKGNVTHVLVEWFEHRKHGNVTGTDGLSKSEATLRLSNPQVIPWSALLR